MTRYDDLLRRRQNQYGSLFSSADLTPAFVSAFNTGERITVEFDWGERRRGTVGVTTGWRPTFILMLTRRSLGSSYALTERDKEIRS